MRIHHALRHHGLLRVAEKTTDESPPLSPNTYRRRSAGSSENAPRLKRLTFDLFVACFFVCFCAVWCAAISHNASRRPCALRARVSPRCTPAPSRRARDFSALPELSPLVKLLTHTHTLTRPQHNNSNRLAFPRGTLAVCDGLARPQAWRRVHCELLSFDIKYPLAPSISASRFTGEGSDTAERRIPVPSLPA